MTEQDEDRVVQLSMPGVVLSRLAELDRRVARLEVILVSLEGGSIALAVALRLLGVL